MESYLDETITKAVQEVRWILRSEISRTIEKCIKNQLGLNYQIFRHQTIPRINKIKKVLTDFENKTPNAAEFLKQRNIILEFFKEMEQLNDCLFLKETGHPIATNFTEFLLLLISTIEEESTENSC